MASSTQTDSQLVARLRLMHGRWRLVYVLTGVAHSFVIAAVTVLAACAVDALCGPPLYARYLLAGATYAIVLGSAWCGWLRDALRPFSPERVAWRVEDAFPELNEELISSVELARNQDRRLSMEFIESLLKDASVDLAKIRPDVAFPLGWRHFRTALMIAAAVVAAFCIPALRLPARIGRVILPSFRDASAGPFVVELVSPRGGTVSEGDSVAVVVNVSDARVHEAELVMQDQRVQTLPMAYDEAIGMFVRSIDSVRDGFLLWAQVGDVKSKTYTIQVNRRPDVEQFRVTYEFPAFSGLESVSVETTSGDLQALRGTRVTLDARATEPLSDMVLELPGAKQSAVLAADGMTGTATFPIMTSGRYTLRLRDRQGLDSFRPLTYAIVAVEDDAPSVTFTQPETDLHLDTDEAAALAWTARDDYGITAQVLAARVNGRGRSIELGVAARARTLPMSELAVQPGDDVELVVKAHDATGHVGASEPRRIVIGGGRALRHASAYQGALEQLAAHLRASGAQLRSARDLREAHGSQQTFAQAAHAARLLGEHVAVLQRELTGAQRAAADLKTSGFFPNSPLYSELVKRYVRQERLLSVPDLTVVTADEATSERVEEMVALCAQMTVLLQQKARQQVAAIETPLLRLQLDRVRELEDSLRAERVMRMARRCLKLAAGIESRRVYSLEELLERGDALATQRGLVSILDRLAREARELAADFSDLDRLARAIRKRLVPLHKAVEELAADAADAEKRPEALEKARDLAADLREAARATDDPTEKADDLALADALKRAAADADEQALREIAEAMAELERDRALEEMQKEIREARAEAERVLGQMQRETTVPDPELADVRQETEEALSQARVAALEVSEAELRPIEQQLERAESQAAAAEQMAAREDPTGTRRELSRAERALAEAERRADELVARQNDRAELARDHIERMAVPESQRIREAQQEVADIAAQLAQPATERQPVSQLQDRLANAAGDVGDVAERLSADAGREVVDEGGDMPAAAEKAALSGLLRDINAREMNEGRQGLEQLASATDTSPASDAAAPAAPDQAAQRAQQAVEAAATRLERAAEQLEQHEAAEDRQIALAQAEQVHDAIMTEAGEQIPAEAQRGLDELGRLRQAADEIDAMADESARLENRQAAEQARQLGDQAGVVSEDLAEFAATPASPPPAAAPPPASSPTAAAPLSSELLARAGDTAEQLQNALMRAGAAQRQADARAHGADAAAPDQAGRQAQAMERLEDVVEAQQQTVQRTAAPLERELAAAGAPAAQAAAEALQHLQRNAELQAFEAAERNLDAFRENVRAAAAEEGADSQSPMQAGMAALEQGLQMAGQERRPMLERALEAARDGDAEAARDLARQAVAPNRPEAGLAEQLGMAADSQGGDVAPMERAAALAEQNQFGRALDELAQTSVGQEATEALRAAEAASREAAREALDRAMQALAAESPAASAMAEAAREVMAGNLEEAAARAQEAGAAGSEIMPELERAQALAETARESAAEALRDAREAVAGVLQDAGESMAVRTDELAEQQADARAAAAAAEPGTEERAAAQATAAEAGQSLAAMERAAAQAASNRPAAAEQAVREAGQGGVEAAEAADAFERALAGQPGEAGQPPPASGAAGAPPASGEPGSPAAAGLPSPGQPGEAGQQMSAAGETPASGEPGPPAAGLPSPGQPGEAGQQMSAAGAAGETPASGEPGSPAAAGMPQQQGAASGAGANVAAAVGSLQDAQAQLQTGQATAGSTTALESAARQLSQAAAEAASATAQALDSALGGGEPRQGAWTGRFTPASAPAGGGLGKGNAWQGVNNSLAGSSTKGRKIQYDAYYRQANARYLESVARRQQDNLQRPGKD